MARQNVSELFFNGFSQERLNFAILVGRFDVHRYIVLIGRKLLEQSQSEVQISKVIKK